MRTILILLLLFVMGNTHLLQVAGQECLPTQLEIGSSARVTPGAANRIRSAANRNADQIGQIPAGEVVTVLEGPVCTDGFLWWRVSYGNTNGWTVEGDDTDYYMEPYVNVETNTATDTDVCMQEPRLQLTEFGQVSSAVPIRLRVEPGIHAEQIGQLNPAEIFVIADGPICKDGFNWWQVEINDVLAWLTEGDGETYFVEMVTDVSLLSDLSTPQPDVITHEISWNTDGSRLAVATSLGVFIYNTADWSQEPYLLDHGIYATNLSFSSTNPDLLVINSENQSFRFRAYLLSDMGETVLFEQQLMEGPMGGEISAYDFAFSADGTQLSFGGRSFEIFDTDTWQEVNHLQIDEEAGNHYIQLPIVPSDLNSTGDYGAGVVDGGTVQLFDFTIAHTSSFGKEDPRISIFDRGGRMQDVTAIQFSPDDTHLLTGDATGSLQMWQLESGTRTSFIRAEGQGSLSNRINDIAFHPDGEEIVTAESDPRGVIRVFTTETLEPSMVFTSDENHSIAHVVSYSPDGDILVTVMDNMIYLLETTNYTTIHQIVISQP